MKDKTLDELSFESNQTLNLKSIDLPKTSGPAIEYPQLLAKLTCGLFGISDDFIEKYQSLDQLFVKNKFSTFFFEAAGDSMEPTIFPGQILIVDRSRQDFHGHVCVVCLDDSMICKRVFQKENIVILKSDNHKYKDIVVENNESLSFWGVVIANAGFIK
jgi:DNA polymerase V